MAGVAQLVEHRTVDAAVAGSSPVARPIKKPVIRPVFLLNLIAFSSLSRFPDPETGLFLIFQPT